MPQFTPITVSIMGSEYHVSSPEAQVEKLQAAANDLDKRMREIKSGGRIVGVERIAVMAALNLCYEILSGDPTELKQLKNINNRINKLNEEVNSVLASSR